jgi:transcriptional accessory protein Tex/SPT6
MLIVYTLQKQRRFLVEVLLLAAAAHSVDKREHILSHPRLGEKTFKKSLGLC